jgi:hypothetical protein
MAHGSACMVGIQMHVAPVSWIGAESAGLLKTINR